jgi:hypothetical protein
MAAMTQLGTGSRIMNLIRHVSAGLLLFGGMLPAQAEACWWPLFGCGLRAPMAQYGPACGVPMYGPMAYSPRMNRRWVYKSHTRTRISGPAMFGDATMGIPMGDCNCGQAPMIMPQSAPLLVPQSSMYPQPMTTYLDVPKTIMRHEAVQVHVPTTTYQQVTVDEGGYQQVWVPRMVTKNVPQTVMQTQIQYRQVPQTVVERVPQVSTQCLPQQSMIGSVYSSPTAVYGGYPIATPTSVTPVLEYNPPPLNPVPSPMSGSATVPHPVAPQASQIQEWQQVRQRQTTIEQQKYEYEMQSEPQTEGYRVPQAAGRFSSKR